MMNFRQWFLLGCAGLLFMAIGTSCGIRKRTTYFQPTENGKDSIAVRFYSPVYRSNDLLSVTVSAMDAEAAKPFNTTVISYNTEDFRATSAPMQQGYFVDSAGMIDFPVVGKIKVGGLNRSEATQLIKQKLAPYIVDPLVIIKIMNYRVTILGDVRIPGTFPVSAERMTIPEALGLAGDMNMTGLRKNVLVIREIDGVKTEYRVDLTSKDVYNSPAYYLHQNDVVYVEANRAKRNTSAISGTNAGIFISTVSLVLTMINILTK